MKTTKKFFVGKVGLLEIGTEYRYRRHFLKNVPLSVPSLLFLQNINIDIVASFKVQSALL